MTERGGNFPLARWLIPLYILVFLAASVRASVVDQTVLTEEIEHLINYLGRSRLRLCAQRS